MLRIESVIIGAGVVGLAVARELALKGKEVAIFEQENSIGSKTSSRNSEVIHAGIYYPKDSLKAKLCIAGKQMLYEYCDTYEIPHKRIGKMIVAVCKNDLLRLESIRLNAEAVGVRDLTKISKQELKEREPNIKGIAAILSPSTGIIDSHRFMESLSDSAITAGAMLGLRHKIKSIIPQKDGLVLQVDCDGGENFEVLANQVINSAGLNAWSVANSIHNFDKKFIPPCYYAKGSYFKLAGKSPFSKLIYPIPPKDSLGTHLTIDLAGQVKFGPNLQWLLDIKEDYSVSVSDKEIFLQEIEQYYPEIRNRIITPDYAGIRPKIYGPNEPVADFLIQSVQSHQVSGLINLFGIESPGLTSSLAIAKYISNIVENVT